MLVVPGAEITQNRLRGRKNSHIIALDIQRYISADQSASDILKEIRRQNALSIACHPHHRTTRRIEISTGYLWDHREQLSELVDVWEAEDARACGEELARGESCITRQRRHRAHALPQWLVGGVNSNSDSPVVPSREAAGHRIA
jgi:hypothetical protein